MDRTLLGFDSDRSTCRGHCRCRYRLRSRIGVVIANVSFHMVLLLALTAVADDDAIAVVSEYVAAESLTKYCLNCKSCETPGPVTSVDGTASLHRSDAVCLSTGVTTDAYWQTSTSGWWVWSTR